jgi:hypothetical protein
LERARIDRAHQRLGERFVLVRRLRDATEPLEQIDVVRIVEERGLECSVGPHRVSQLGCREICQAQPERAQLFGVFGLVEPLLQEPRELVEMTSLGVGRFEEVDRFDSNAATLPRDRLEARDRDFVAAVEL